MMVLALNLKRENSVCSLGRSQESKEGTKKVREQQTALSNGSAAVA